MILGFHTISTAYGFWLPNDPRGSWSDFVGSWELLRFGKATKIEDRRAVAHVPHDSALRLEAKKRLRHAPVFFTDAQISAIANGFGRAIDEGNYVAHACSILPDHVHLLIAPHHRPIRRIVGHLKARATQELVAAGLHPFAHLRGADGELPTVWTERSWEVFIDNPDWMHAAARYIEKNPVKGGAEGRRLSSFVRWKVSTENAAGKPAG